MNPIQNTLRSQVFAGLENVTSKKATALGLPSAGKAKSLTADLMGETTETEFCSPFDRKHEAAFTLLEEGPCRAYRQLVKYHYSQMRENFSLWQ